jgi:hypothetical protein
MKGPRAAAGMRELSIPAAYRKTVGNADAGAIWL